ncbi:MAG TPA: N(G),N(G)-dimethylarginine dimethylaminohydrolase [Chloroflexi bacterium]|nr:MAG: N(G),N(G)-dimethylarginine dimethylaminohydrolase [Chloroflexota bacterium]HDD54679.1 N(G),N(G)-dimethylarginine dimethylaminohydrolase [Chloroflexota bacterium]
MFTRALVRPPGRSLVEGLTTANLGEPKYHKAVDQHAAYVEALQACGLDVCVLPPLEDFPDSCFIEDVALLTPRCAIITRPGAPSRMGEIGGMREILSQYYAAIEQVQAPGTVEGGDILMVGSHFYIGLSARTNLEGARQVIEFLKDYDLSGSTVPLQEILHLKTGIAYLEENTLAACGEILSREEFSSFTILPVPEEESYAANCIWVNGTVLVPAGFPRTSGIIQKAGYPVLEVDVSEFRKLDGGLSCLSLRF